MSQFGDLYAQYYDLLYKDKDYIKEVEYIYQLIKKFNPDAKRILDLGCGTGKHAELFCKNGFSVHGVDMSDSMLKKAEERTEKYKDTLSFSKSDITELNLNEKFDVVTSLFHVISYQNDNDKLIKAFNTAYNHLDKDGIFIFDFWYGPAVLTDRPVTRVKRLENDYINVIRLSEPKMNCTGNIVDVHFEVLITEKNKNQLYQKTECHSMRYLFDTELELISNQLNFDILTKLEWLSNNVPNYNSWNVVWVIQKSN